MPKFYEQLEEAAIENLASDPSNTPKGRFWYNTVSGLIKFRHASTTRPLLLNDDKLVIGNSGTAAQNIRLNRAAAGVLQFILGNDVTSEGTLSTTPAQLSFKFEQYTTAGRPNFGNAGRCYWDTDQVAVLVDTGAAWENIGGVPNDNSVSTIKVQDLAITNAKLAQAYVHDLTAVTPVAADFVAGADASDSNNKKKFSVGLLRNAVSRSVVTTDAVGADDETMRLSGVSFTSTLPAIGVAGKRYKFIHKGTSITNVYTLATTGGNTIGGIASGSYALYTNGEVLEVEDPGSGTDWLIVGRRTATLPASVGAISYSATAAYVFTVTAANATLGAIYSNNGQTFTVTTTITGTTTLTCSGSGTPAASGTLTKVTGTGDATITFSSRTITGVPVFGTTNVTNDLTWWRDGGDGSWAWLKYSFAWDTAGTAGSGYYIFQLPTGLSLDTTRLTVYTGLGAYTVKTADAAIMLTQGNVAIVGGSASFASVALAYSTTSFRIRHDSGGNAVLLASDSFSFGNGTYGAYYMIKAPILSWQP
jgi:hypothetical protein